MHNKVVRRVSAFGFFFIVFLVISVPPVLANVRQEVLGNEVSSSDITIPPTVEGPGLILPDSPLFFLDTWKQQARVLLSFSPESRLAVRSSIAGERLAELRIMLAKDDAAGIETDLRGIQDNLQAAADEVRNTQLSGRAVVKLARDTNDNLKLIRASLDVLEAQAAGSIRARVRVTQDALQEAKVVIVEVLPEPERTNEVQNDLSRLAARRVIQSTESVEEWEHQLNMLQEKRDAESEKALTVRSEALKVASGTASQKAAEQMLEKEKMKQGRVHTLTQQAIDNARKALKNAQEAATGFIELEKLIQELRNTPADRLVSTSSAKSK